MIANKTESLIACRGLRSALPVRLHGSGKRSIVVRYKEEDRKPFDLENLEESLEQTQQPRARGPTDTRLSREQLEEVYSKEVGNISPRVADMRADLGTAATDLSQLQAFDGPAPETINGRLAMLGVYLGLTLEFYTGQTLMEQVQDHPITVFAAFVIISIASYVPIVRGYTRKEPYSNHFIGFNWTPRAENWNGRIAMLGFAGMVLAEWITHVNTWQAWGLQPVPFTGFTY